jgi:UDP-N-acetylglucosamine--N-acetylmuramyl-(pentapeptide) pyrophosphoryl-undecaprenol N-acetylglucosamine transferase
MHEAYAAADIVLSRAGALSVSELAVLLKPAVLVPFPFASEDHQTQNAKTLSDKNAAILLPDDKVSDLLHDTILALAENKTQRENLSKEIGYFAKPNAAKEIVDIIHQIIKN